MQAISEPNFTPQYAHICTEMHKKDTKRTAGTKPKTTFKKLLTTCCQDRLNEMQAHDEALSKTLQELEKGDDQVNIRIESLNIVLIGYDAIDERIIQW